MSPDRVLIGDVANEEQRPRASWYWRCPRRDLGQALRVASLAAALASMLLCALLRPARVPGELAGPLGLDTAGLQTLASELDQDARIRVACVGASITKGSQSSRPYPAQLQEMLGDRYWVKNFGYEEATAMARTDTPYWTTVSFRSATAFNPHVIVLQFGANDARTYNWKPHGKDFAPELLALIGRFLKLPAQPKVLAMVPPPLYNDGEYSMMSKVVNEILPVRIPAALEKAGLLPPVDVFGAFARYCPALDTNNCFLMNVDGVHPNEHGDWVMAQVVARAIRGNALERTPLGPPPSKAPPQPARQSSDEPASAGCGYMEDNVEYVGGQVLSEVSTVAAAEDCCALCQGGGSTASGPNRRQQQQVCQAWSFTKREPPAPFLLAHTGTCADAGYVPIADAPTCELASRALQLGSSSATVCRDPDRPEGCYYFGAAEDPAFKIWLGVSVLNRGMGTGVSADGRKREQICQFQDFRISTTTCEDIRAEIIHDKGTCRLAGKTLGLKVNEVQTTADAGRPDGCYLYASERMVFLGTNPKNAGMGAETSQQGELRQPICATNRTEQLGKCVLKAEASALRRQPLAGRVSGAPKGPTMLSLAVQLRNFNGLCLDLVDAELPWDLELRLQHCWPGEARQLWHYNQTTGEIWRKAIDGGSPFCVDVAKGSRQAAGKPCDSARCQAWYHEPTSGQLLGHCRGKQHCLGPKSRSGYGAAQLWTWPCNDTGDLRWNLSFVDANGIRF